MQQSTFNTPVFVAFTGVDSSSQLAKMQTLSVRYPIEWGVLIDVERAGNPCFPTLEEIACIQHSGLRLAAHVCGSLAQSIASAGKADIDLGGFTRVQINHSFSGSDEAHIMNCHRFGLRHGLRVVLQCQSEFPPDARTDWLYDASFGTGQPAAYWPALRSVLPFCGYSGGLGPQTVAAELQKIGAPRALEYWIDMESGVRTDGKFDLEKCAQVCKQVFDTASETTP